MTHQRMLVGLDEFGLRCDACRSLSARSCHTCSEHAAMTLPSLAIIGFLVAALTGAEPATTAAKAVELPPPVERQISFQRDVQPILQRACWDCHGSESWESGLRLDRKEKTLAGGDGGAVIVAGNSAESRLIHFVSGIVPDKLMPPEGERLSNEDIGILRAWIDQGLDWPAARRSPMSFVPIQSINS
ncbi:MAG: hypothetical protein B7Z55_19235 [Planctomycetales bacterium 12-60-4]|nr:MAG: hypothetical protein B7Z55_19235 [Planctomycetales bacterium 12-60-4]